MQLKIGNKKAQTKTISGLAVRNQTKENLRKGEENPQDYTFSRGQDTHLFSSHFSRAGTKLRLHGTDPANFPRVTEEAPVSGEERHSIWIANRFQLRNPGPEIPSPLSAP